MGRWSHCRTSAALVVDERLPANRRYCRAWTAQFLSDLSRVHYGRFHRALQVNSAVRTVEYQRHLERVNGNAAPAEGDDASPHLTGATIDIAKKGLSMEEVGWMRAYLAPLQAAGKIDVEEEFYQACFHITVYRSYRPEARVVETKAKGNAHHPVARRCWRNKFGESGIFHAQSGDTRVKSRHRSCSRAPATQPNQFARRVMTETGIPSSGEALATPALSQGERVIDTFIAPSKTFTDILRSQSWWLPFLISSSSAMGIYLRFRSRWAGTRLWRTP